MKTVSRCTVASGADAPVYRKRKAKEAMGTRLGPEPSTMRFDNRPTDAQTDPHAAWLVGCSRLPQVLQSGCGHSRTAVFHLDRQPVTLSAGSNHDGPASTRTRRRLE